MGFREKREESGSVAVKEVVYRAIPFGAVGIPGRQGGLKMGGESSVSLQPAGRVVAIRGLNGKLSSPGEQGPHSCEGFPHCSEGTQRVCLLALF